MTFLALLLAFLVEQIRPLPRYDRVWLGAHRVLVGALRWLPVRSNYMAVVVWLTTVIGGGAATWLIYAQLRTWHGVAAFLFSLVVLYALLGFRYHERMYSDIHLALSTGQMGAARDALARWRHSSSGPAGSGSGEIARLAVEHGLVTAHRCVFAPILWFVLLPGPVGVVMYRLAQQLAEDADIGRPSDGRVSGFAMQAYEGLEWLPCRLTALAYSMLGHFEDALACWRQQAPFWSERCAGVLIAAGGGALGVRLGLPVHAGEGVQVRPQMGLGERADVGAMRRAAGLVWRVLVFYMLMVALVGVAGWAGH